VPIELGAGAMVAGAIDDVPHAWALLPGENPGEFGGALARTPADAQLHVICVEAASVPSPAMIARRAAGFTNAPKVWQLADAADKVRLAEVQPLESRAPNADVPVGDPHVELMRRTGAEVVVDDGAVVGEVLGLEVARIRTGHDGQQHLDVGVGAYDQEAFATINPDLASDDALAAVVAEVQASRRAGADPHPLNRLVRERWIRAQLIAHPGIIGLRRVAPIPSLRPRNGLRDLVPAAALGTSSDGEMVGVVCSAGIDFDLVPTAADIVQLFDVTAVHLVLPRRDQYPHVLRSAALLRVPVIISDAPVLWE